MKVRIYRCDKCGKKVAFVFWVDEMRVEVCTDCYQRRLRRQRRDENEKREMHKMRGRNG